MDKPYTMSEFVTYRRFSSLEDALYYTTFFTENDIEYEVEHNKPPVDATFSGPSVNHEVNIKIKAEDFAKADLLLEESAEAIDISDGTYYLLDFSDEELLNVIRKYDEWSVDDVVLAQKILKDRGKEISVEKVKELKDERLAQQRKPQSVDGFWLMFSYVLAVLTGWIGIVVGLYFKTFKKTLANGERVFVYDEKSRRKGQILFVLSSVWLLLLLLMALTSKIWTAIIFSRN